jgi:hypothetical protein
MEILRPFGEMLPGVEYTISRPPVREQVRFEAIPYQPINVEERVVAIRQELQSMIQ